MSIFLTLGRVTRFAWHHLYRNAWLSLMTVLMLILAVLNINALVLLNVIGDQIITSVESRFNLSVSFLPGTSEALIEEAKNYLAGLPQVRSISLLNSEEVLQEFLARYESDKEALAALEEIGENPFGAELTISTFTAEEIPFLLQALDHPLFASSIDQTSFEDYQTLVEQITSVFGRIERAGLAIGLIFTLIALLIVFNSVRISIYSHREEIGIMRLVGASGVIVRGPFILNAILETILAVVLGALVIVFSILIAEPWLQSFFGSFYGDLKKTFILILPLAVLGELFLLGFLTVAATMLATRRFLRI